MNAEKDRGAPNDRSKGHFDTIALCITVGLAAIGATWVIAWSISERSDRAESNLRAEIQGSESELRKLIEERSAATDVIVRQSRAELEASISKMKSSFDGLANSAFELAVIARCEATTSELEATRDRVRATFESTIVRLDSGMIAVQCFAAYLNTDDAGVVGAIVFDTAQNDTKDDGRLANSPEDFRLVTGALNRLKARFEGDLATKHAKANESIKSLQLSASSKLGAVYPGSGPSAQIESTKSTIAEVKKYSDERIGELEAWIRDLERKAAALNTRPKGDRPK